jgi:hypothetical protein
MKTLSFLLLANCGMVGNSRPCAGELDSFNTCVVSEDPGFDIVAWDQEVGIAITTYSTWSKLPYDLLVGEYRAANVDAYLLKVCEECGNRGTTAFTEVADHTIGKRTTVTEYYTMEISYYYARDTGCWASWSAGHETLHVMEYLHAKLTMELGDFWKSKEMHPDNVFGSDKGTPENIIRYQRMEANEEDCGKAKWEQFIGGK